MGAVVALAGRRIDAEGVAQEESRFPAANRETVLQSLEAFFARSNASTLVSSAACGADLLALDVAGRLGLRRRVVLPTTHESFRGSSVVDRGDEDYWEPLYKRIIREVTKSADLIVLDLNRQGADAYLAANERILDEAEHRAAETQAETIALIVWEGAPRGGEDITAAFAQSGRNRGMRVEEILTR